MRFKLREVLRLGLLSGCLLALGHTLAMGSPVSAQGEGVYFSPGGGVEETIVKHLAVAQKEILVAMYTLTSRRLSQALVQAKGRGVDIRVLVGQSPAQERFSKFGYLSGNGIKVKLAQPEKGLMHHKFAIIDRRVVLTGSYNWTASAEEYNHENLLVLKAVDVVGSYIQEFERLWRRY